MSITHPYERVALEHLCVRGQTNLRNALETLNKNGLGILLLVDDEDQFIQALTDGDLRRFLLDNGALSAQLADLPYRQSITIDESQAPNVAKDLMDQHSINHLPVLDQDNKVVTVLLRSHFYEQIALSTPHMGDEEKAFVQEAFDTNWIAPLGPNVNAFEEELAALVGVSSAAALSSGTAAIHLGLRLLGVAKQDRVFVSTLTFVASVNPIIYEGGEPVFIDSEAESWNMCPEALARAFEEAEREGWRPKCVIVVHLYGQNAQMDKIQEICDHYDVPILEDAAESLGSTYKGKSSGTMGRIGIYSFNGNKIITTSGGGALVSDDDTLVARARHLATQAREDAPYYHHSEIGFNYRMSNILAGVGRGQLRVLAKRVEARRHIFDTYQASLAAYETFEFLEETPDNYANRWLSVGRLTAASQIDVSQFIAQLAAQKIEARRIWKPMHLQPVFSDFRLFTAHDNCVSDAIFQTGLCLPSGSNMTSGQQARVIDAMAKILDGS